MSPSTAIIPTDRQLVCHHIVGITPSQVSGPGYGPLVYVNYQEPLRVYGGMKFHYCPLCGMELEDEK